MVCAYDQRNNGLVSESGNYAFHIPIQTEQARDTSTLWLTNL